MTMKVLVLGIDEFIGSRTAAALAASGWAQPMADPAGIRVAGVAGVMPLAGTATDAGSLAQALDGVDAVVNCVSKDPGAIAATAARLFAATRGRDPLPLVVHVSSMSVYGAAEGRVDEDAPLTGELGAYAGAKVEAEALAQAYPRSIILRPGCEYGPGGELWSTRIARWLAGRRIGDLGIAGDGICNLVHIDDVSAAVGLALRNPLAVGRQFNLAIADPPSWNEYLVKYARALGAVPVRRISARSLRLESRILAVPLKAMELGARRLGIEARVAPPITASFVSLARQSIVLDAARARSVLDWHCLPLDEGIAQTAAWFNRTHRPQPRS